MAGRIVCVTGASGMIASWLVKRLLQSGYSVRGTVRDPENTSSVSHLWELADAKERLQLFKADLSSEGDFDAIVEGCEGVFHTASPAVWIADDPERDIVQTAVQGAINVLKACKKSSSVKRVVVTSSAATVSYSEVSPDTAALDESVWSSVEYCRTNQLWYPLSKTLAEQAAWDFAAENDIDLVTVIPSVIIGEFVGPPKTSILECLKMIKGEPSIFDSEFCYFGIVHQDDVALAHILVFEMPEATGRYLCSATNVTNLELASRFGNKHNISKLASLNHNSKPLCSKKLETLGIQFRGMDQMVEACLRSLRVHNLI